MNFVGRKNEIARLTSILDSNKSEFVALYGRRRVGKTELVRKVLKDKFSFYVTAIANSSKKQQLTNFTTALQKYTKKPILEFPENWFDAFRLLILYLENLDSKRIVIFIDELPWFDNQKSDFIPSLEHFWNSWASQRQNIVLLVCGSSASWMINKLINHKGGLHNRITENIKLEPFILAEAELMLKQINPAISRYQILQLYMVIGGIPFYLEKVKSGLSAMQNIELMCFGENAPLRLEYTRLFKALFSKPERHEAIVRAIAKKAKGLVRKEIIKYSGLSNSGTLTAILEELEQSGFIRRYQPFNKKKQNSLYQLVDFYTLFYLKFIEGADTADKNNWINSLDSPAYRAWSGYTFEQVVLYHIYNIKKALGIHGIVSNTFSWRSTVQEGAQIDLIIDRKDQVINLCEIKFSQEQFTISKSYAGKLRKKISIFRNESKTKKSIFLTLITTFGLNQNAHSLDLVQNQITMDALFE